MKAAFQLDNMLSITDPGSEDRDAALLAFAPLISAFLPEDSPIIVYNAEERRKVTRPGRAILFDDLSVLLIVEVDEDGTLTKAFDAQTPEGGLSVYEALKETIFEPQFAILADAAREVIGEDNIVEGVESAPGSFRAI